MHFITDFALKDQIYDSSFSHHSYEALMSYIINYNAMQQSNVINETCSC